MHTKYCFQEYYSSTFRCNKLVFMNTLKYLSLPQVDQRNVKFFYPAFKGPSFLSLQLKTPIKPQERTMSRTKMRQNKLEGGGNIVILRGYFFFLGIFFIDVDICL